MAADDTMNPLQRVLGAIADELEAAGRDWALLGGLAVSVYVPPRFTRDVDVAVAVDSDAQAERLVHRLQGAGYGVGMVLEQDAAGRLATVRVLPPGEPPEGIVVDLMFASSGIEPEICRAAESIEVFPGLRAPVARPGHLVALKILARDDVLRPQDIADIRALLPVLDKAELQRARQALDLIAARGFHRDRDLAAALASLVADGGLRGDQV